MIPPPQEVTVTRRASKPKTAQRAEPPDWLPQIRKLGRTLKREGRQISVEALAEFTPDQAFALAREMYPGTKRPFGEEWANFRKKHTDWKTVAYDLYPAIEIIKGHWALKRKRSEFVENWKHFSTWINNRWWTTAEGILDEREEIEDTKRLRGQQQHGTRQIPGDVRPRLRGV